MPESKKEKIVVISTHGPDDPERASFPFVMANAALAMEVEVTVVLQGPAVYLSKKSCYEHVFAPGLPALKELIETFISLGGKMLICQPCIQERNIRDDMLVERAEVTASGRVVQEVLEATAVLNY